ncbi:bifunctional ATP-dependent DNA helicase/ssDNA endodeoxyribonuclease DNA2 KNAG_0E00650 [Huiozyma naganishii CBS 8797]|uniref:DNA replication ATP-dependent helicase/nuclease DNA2 n=1 Tax=Huiozyma naganishii (strain ATCC MYA-139 / BCRC 22969 / CBS 8797 / KCTC 17520 / NBRC 10181 / NCYC 3082 / Yp74L-3) TaxID=1071383 RepID=J7RLD7_HUIN7|nr:hypothetical protein KNAG_0E00650 [Kazachstania naganishii CBS 8797]CCK70333.1 hypothetical protein KNAG_0E00650 [Kazachstania naganishii CBS 8797]
MVREGDRKRERFEATGASSHIDSKNNMGKNATGNGAPSTVLSIPKKKKKKKSYQFAPMNNIETKPADETNVLRSISVSQVRNTAKRQNVNNLKSDNGEKLGPLKVVERNTVPITKRNIPKDGSPKPSLSGANAPTEEVVWNYTPDDKLSSDKITPSHIDSSDDSDKMDDNLKNPSSTPMIASRWKSILRFENTQCGEKSNNDGEFNNAAGVLKSETRSENQNTGDKSSVRAIDDILEHLMCDPREKQTNQLKFNDLPSSPVQTDKTQPSNTFGQENSSEDPGKGNEPKATVNMNDTSDPFDESGDDSILRIATQNTVTGVVKRKESLDVKTTHSDLSKIRKLGKNTALQLEQEPNPSSPKKNELQASCLENSFDTLKIKSLLSSPLIQPKIDTEESNDSFSDSDDMLFELLKKNLTERNGQTSGDSKKANNGEREIRNIITKGPNSDLSCDERYEKLARCATERTGVVRLVVTAITRMELPKFGEQKVLSCKGTNGRVESVILRHPWVYLDIEEEDIIHVIEGNNFPNKRLLSDDKDSKTGLSNDNLLILNPDILLSATAIGGSIRCLRSGLIGCFFQNTHGEPSIVMTVGNIVHELLQSALKYKLSHSSVSREILERKLDEILELYLFAIIICDEDVKQVRNDIIDTHVKNILEIVNKFTQENNYGCYVSISGTRRTEPLSISNVIDIEENIWSPMLGIKGFIDATVIAHATNSHQIVPFEIKTGKFKSVAHEAQGLIYTLLLRDRYEIPVDYFLLYYTRETSIMKFPFILHSIKHILMARNKLAHELKYRTREVFSTKLLTLNLPNLSESSYCEVCPNKLESFIISRLLTPEASPETHSSQEEYLILTEYLNSNIQTYREFFVKYNDLIFKEESSVLCSNSEFFRLDSRTRETQNGLTLSNLIVSEFAPNPSLLDSFLYTFVRNPEVASTIPMSSSRIAPKDYIFVSDESGHFVLSQGEVLHVSDTSITVALKRQLLTNTHYTKNSKTCNNYEQIESVLIPKTNEEKLIQSQNTVTYRIDKNNMQQDMSTLRYNVLNLFMPPVVAGGVLTDEKTKKTKVMKASDGGDSKTRQLLLDDRKPRFIPTDRPFLINYDERKVSNFNEDQKRALDHVFRCKDYSLILGMPGTGKTTVISEMIKVFAANGKSVLLTSYTHSAVDNILLKLLDTDLNIIRLGSNSKINPKTQCYLPNYENVKTFQDYKDIIDGASIVATTCLGIKDFLFSLRTKDFDYVILDEASQVSLPVALGPLRYGEKFILVGDHYQLPPLVRNEAARLGGLEDSLFKILSERHPESMVELTFQYRMCKDIIKLSNLLIYEDKMKCANETVQQQSLSVAENYRDIIGGFRIKANDSTSQDWLCDAVNPDNKVVFLDYDNCPGISEVAKGDNITNLGESVLIQLCLEGMFQVGVSCEDVGVMSLYRAQLRLLKEKLADYENNGLEILTADQFQGRDKECVIISMVRCNDELNGGSLLRELRRVNVAMTRAKSKLIIVGSKTTINSVGEINPLMKFIEENCWVHRLPSDALSMYDFAYSSNT